MYYDEKWVTQKHGGNYIPTKWEYSDPFRLEETGKQVHPRGIKFDNEQECDVWCNTHNGGVKNVNSKKQIRAKDNTNTGRNKILCSSSGVRFGQ